MSRNLHVGSFEDLKGSNGVEDLPLWEGEKAHLLILDIMMPPLDGLEVCRGVRQSCARQQTLRGTCREEPVVSAW